MTKVKHILFSMLVPLIMVGLVLIIAYVFCGVGITSNDCFEQYIPFFSAYYDILTEGKSIFYSQTGALGYDFWSVFSYYLVCPLNLIILLFGKSRIVYAVELLILLKIAFSGGTFAAFLKNRFPKVKDNRIVLFSTLYALSGFVAGYAWNVMWMDGIVLFPLVIMGMDILMRDEKPQWFWYTIFLSVLIVCCYFMGYMSCVFIFLYFFTYRFRSFKDFLLKLLRIGLSSILAIGLSAIILVPAFWGLQSTYISGEAMPDAGLYGSFVNSFKTFMLAVPLNAINFDRENANLFITCFGLLLAFVYFTSGSVKVSDKIRKFLLLGILLFSFNFKPLNYIWHGMHEQSGIPNRFSYMVIFVMLTMGFEVCTKKKKAIRRRSMFIAWGILTLGCLVMALFDRTLIINAVLTSVLALSYVFILGFGKGKLKFNFIRVFAFAEVFFTFCMSIFMSCGTLLGDYGYYVDDFEQIRQSKDGAFYREKIDETYNDKEEYFESTISRTPMAELSVEAIKEYCGYMKNIGHLSIVNEGTYYGLNVPSLFNTFHNYNLTKLYYSIGADGGTNNAMYFGENPFMDMLLGIRYYYARYYDVYSGAYEYVRTVGNVGVYENKYSLSVGYAVPDEFLQADISEHKNPFIAMNLMSNGIAGCDIYKENVFDFVSEDKEDRTFVFECKVQNDGEFLLQPCSNETEKIIVKTDDEIKYTGDRSNTIISIGQVKKGQTVTLYLTHKDNDKAKDANVIVYSATVDWNKFEKVYKVLSSQQMEIREYGDSYIKGSINLENDSKVLITVPYAEGWKVSVDGKVTECDRYQNLFYVLDLTKGNHEISFEYATPGFKEGAFISLVSLGAFAISLTLTIILSHRKNQKKKNQLYEN